MDLESIAQRLEQSPDYKVLRRLKEALTTGAVGGDVKNGIYLDVETGGLDLKTDEIIEFGAIPFTFTSTGLIANVGTPLHSYNQPVKKISEKITKLTGISMDMVRGARLPLGQIEELIKQSQLVIAHNAAFDRQMVERVMPAFASVCWGCSMSQVPWDEVYGISGRRLEYIIAGLGRFYDAHTAVADCTAGLYALGATSPAGHPALSYVLEASRKITWHTWAIDAPFSAKDVLKARGYQWNGGEDGRAKAWHREVEDRDAEESWLRDNVYGRALIARARFDRITAFDRFSKRG